jgi:hypothetical protein
MGSGRGKTRRAKLSHSSPSGATADFAIWQSFVDESELTRTPAGEYYEISLPAYSVPANQSSVARCALATELLKDFVATGAIVLPDGVDVSQFKFSIQERTLMLTRTAITPGDPKSVHMDRVTDSTDKFLHSTLELGHKGIHALFTQLRASVFRLIDEW